MSDIHSSLPTFVLRYFPSAITLYSEVAVYLSSIQFVTSFRVIPRQTLLKGVLWYEASFASFCAKPSPSSTFHVFLFVRNKELYANLVYKAM